MQGTLTAGEVLQYSWPPPR